MNVGFFNEVGDGFDCNDESQLFLPHTPGMRVTGSFDQNEPSGRRFTFHVDLLSPVSEFTYTISVFACFSYISIVTTFSTYSRCAEDGCRW